MGLKICLAIGVADAEGLPFLGGAITAAQDVGLWATRSRFDRVQIVTDGQKIPVTMSRLRDVLDALLPDDGKVIDTFILHFAGHGLREAAERNLWLLSDWRRELRAVAVEVLRSRLNQRGIAHLAIFSDACRALPNDIEIALLTPDAVLGLGPFPEARPILDRFNAVVDGKEAYMIPGVTVTDARCIFSGALVEGLWGLDQRAFDNYLEGKVTSESLDLFLKMRMKDLGQQYLLKCVPDNLTGTPRDHLIYYDQANPPTPGIKPPAWPVVADTPSARNPIGPVSNFYDIINDPLLLQTILGPKFGTTNPSINITKGIPPIGDTAKDALEALARARVLVDETPLNDNTIDGARWNASRARIEVERVVVAQLAEERARDIVDGFVLNHFNLGRDPSVNLVVLGGSVLCLWSMLGRHSVRRISVHSQVYEARLKLDHSAEQILVEFVDGLFAPLIIYKGLVTVLSRNESGIVGWACVSPNGQHKHNFETSISTIARLRNGQLGANDVDKLAVQLREQKHLNPVLGAIAAYLYDYSGDIDSIRRMAYFYVANGQPIPYDIAFMGMLNTVPDDHACLTANVPAVAARTKEVTRSQQPRQLRLPRWVTQRTEKIHGPVAGLCPWLRRGWDFVQAPEEAERALVAGLSDVRQYLLPSDFTAFTSEGGKRLIALWNLETNQ